MYERIKKKRIELEMTQDELAKKTGFTSRSSISKIESGENDIPQSRVIDFAKALKVSPGYLMGWEEEHKKVETTEHINVPETFQSPEDALKFILDQPALMAYGGYDFKTMSEEEIIDIAENMLFSLKLSLEKRKKNRGE